VDRLAWALEDQALMARARNYFAWQARLLTPEVGRRVVEVGCGTGNFTGLLLDPEFLNCEFVIALDKEPACVERLRERFPGRGNLHTLVCSPGSAEFASLTRFQADCCICLNVLEHIEDDAGALCAMAEIIPRGGRIVLMLPAFPTLYGPIDRNSGHYRRYTKRSVDYLAACSGLAVQRISFMNFPGFFGWWANARLFRRESQSAGQIDFFDRWLVPAISRVEAKFPPPFGQSLIAVLARP
jgi:SAM-dependent methyltransferase